MSASAKDYAQALREAAMVVAVMKEEVYWIDDGVGCEPSQLAVKWRFSSRAKAEAFRDSMVREFHPTWLRTEQPSEWGCITMDIPQYPMVGVAISFNESPKE